MASKTLPGAPGNLASAAAPAAVLGDVARALADATAVKLWWEQKDAANSYEAQFELARAFNQPDRATGFFDHAPLQGQPVPVMGAVQEMAYDRPKHTAGKGVCEAFREFILHYFMRVSDFHEPETWAAGGPPPPTAYLPGVSWCPRPEVRRVGFGYSQHFYKLRATGEVGVFPASQRYAIVDLREIGPKYEWVVAKVQIFDFRLTFQPLGPESLAFDLPLQEENYLLLAPAFITDRARPASGVLGEYGFGYALLRTPDAGGLLAYGPGRFGAGFQLFNFRVLDSGETRARLVFVVNRPGRVLSVPLDPIDWAFRLADLFSFGAASLFFGPVRGLLARLPLRLNDFDPVTTYVRLANFLTGGLAAANWCVSNDQLDKYFLVHHFRQNYQMIVGSLLTWRSVPDWLDGAALPRGIVTGVTS